MQCVRSLTLLLLLVVKVHGDFVEPPQPHTSLCSLAESQTRLPCRYQPVGGEKVVQVTWYKELADGSKDQIITAHFSEGHTEFGRYSGRVKFESSSPTENSALLIPSTEESDEGSYICHISTFPHGTFERHITLTVWILPISSLDPVILKEGDSYRLAATCKAEGRPRPRLSWDTDLPGQGKDKYHKAGSVSSYFSLHPLRSMNGKKLDCLVWHPCLNGSRRISNLLEVQYPPDTTITSVSGDWFVGLENAELVCDSGGNPKPQDFTWTRRGGALPDGVSVVGGKLVFGRTLRLNDSGVYECVAKNIAGAGKAEYSVTIAESSQGKGVPSHLLLIILGSSAAVTLVLVLILVVLLVNRHHRNRNRKFKRQITEKTDENEKNFRQGPLIRNQTPVTINVIVQEPPIYEGSQSTLGGKRSPPGGVELDELRCPVVQQDGRESLRQIGMNGEKEEQRRRVESFVMRCNKPLRPINKLSSSLPGRNCRFLAEVELEERGCLVVQHHSKECLRHMWMDGEKEEPTKRTNSLVKQKERPREPDLSHLGEGGSPHVEDWAPTQSVEEEREEQPLIDLRSAANQVFFSNGFL
ncbi:nectin-4 isoform X2 [Pleuronectes platessa]|uniref:nectin-4 isoform X2 n=1 Tax=Pleuronectes platessa TaxID=8262 RepID=UPI00232A1D9D|nr:nectin-4 isoform X2 [Pleuronectes platessa]